MSDWDVDAAKAALDTELHVQHQGENSPATAHVDVARRKFTEATALIADRMIHMALYSESESMAFKAGSYIMDRVMGRVSDAGFRNADEDDLLKLVRKVYEGEQVGN